MENKLAIITVNYNHSDRTINLIKSLEKLKIKNFILYIVNNKGDDKDLNNLEKYLSASSINSKIIYNELNNGWGNALNIGFEEINKLEIPYTLVINNDVIIKDEAIEKMINFLILNPIVGICGPKILSVNGSIQTVGGRLDNLVKYFGITRENIKNHNLIKEKILNDNETIDDCAWMIRSKIMNQIKYPSYLFLYFEELYIINRIRKLGYKLAYLPDAEVIHEGQVSSREQKETKSKIQTFYLNRNRIIFIKDNYPNIFPISLVCCLLITIPMILIKYFIKQDFDSIKQILRGTKSGLQYSLLNKITYFT